VWKKGRLVHGYRRDTEGGQVKRSPRKKRKKPKRGPVDRKKRFFFQPGGLWGAGCKNYLQPLNLGEGGGKRKGDFLGAQTSTFVSEKTKPLPEEEFER